MIAINLYANRIKPCRKCGIFKDLAQRCRTCMTAYSRDYTLRHKYGLNRDEIVVLRYSQNSSCAVCCIELLDGGNVDHNHATGAIRGMLCRNCNLAAGLLRDNPTTCRMLADYLENANSISVNVDLTLCAAMHLAHKLQALCADL